MAIWNFSNSFFKKDENITNLWLGAEQDPYPLQTKSLIEQMNIISTFDSSERLREINVPTLIIGCEKDIIFPIENVTKLISMIQNAKYQQISEAAHSVHLEQPELMAKIITQFLMKK